MTVAVASSSGAYYALLQVAARLPAAASVVVVVVVVPPLAVARCVLLVVVVVVRVAVLLLVVRPSRALAVVPLPLYDYCSWYHRRLSAAPYWLYYHALPTATSSSTPTSTVATGL